jgi:hypothetical protein
MFWCLQCSLLLKLEKTIVQLNGPCPSMSTPTLVQASCFHIQRATKQPT